MDTNKTNQIQSELESKLEEIMSSIRTKLIDREYSPGVRQIPPKANGYAFAMEVCRRILKMKKEGGLDRNLDDPELLRFKTQQGGTVYAVQYADHTIGLPYEMDALQKVHGL